MDLQPWPDHLEAVLLAKSADKGADGQPESLAQHTAWVLTRLADFIKLRPNLPQQIGQPRLWHCLYWAAFLHDFGKAMPGFQAVLRKDGDPERKEEWRGQRHEVFSLAFLDWIADGLDDEERLLTAAAVISHHRDADLIQELYNRHEQERLEAHFAGFLPEHVSGLHQWLTDCGWSWAQQLGLDRFGVASVTFVAQPTALFTDDAIEKIRTWLRRYKKFIRQLGRQRNADLLVPLLALRGTLINSDHSASAHAPPLPIAQFEVDDVLASISKPEKEIGWDDLYCHQKKSRVDKNGNLVRGHVLLTAPTGSGKTEAALLWASAQEIAGQAPPRLFYTLPYQASMNAMLRRLQETFDEESAGEDEEKLSKVGLQHGRALLALYKQLMERDESDAWQAARLARWMRNLNQLNYPPVRVFSPYQMLKGMYRIKGYEAQLTDYHNALFIFDEIHAYEVKRLALILKTIEYLRKHYHARFFIMSATFPTLIKRWLNEALDNPTPITATSSLFQKFQRHCLKMIDGELLNNLQLAEKDARDGKSVLVVCNTIRNAQTAFAELRGRLRGTAVELLLLHGNFNIQDRLQKENDIRLWTGSKSEPHERRQVILVATQAVEVSLDIDLDTIYSEPAPLEALVQRFGRINRAHKKGIVPVHVFNQPVDGQGIYHEKLIDGTLQVLARENGNIIDESAVGIWLDEIYAGEVEAEWQREFEAMAKEFETIVVNTLRPFQSDPAMKERFYKAFDGIDVLPNDLLNDYLDLLEQGKMIEAQKLPVSISWGRYHQLKGKGLIRKGDELKYDNVMVDYTSELGLDLMNL